MALLTFILLAFAVGFALSLSGVIVLMLALGPYGKPIGDWCAKIAVTSAWRPAITINDVGDLLLKQRSYNDDLNREEISVGGTTRELEDPQDRIHHFYGIPFALADEIFGVVFNPRDAAAAQRAWEHFDNATFVYPDDSGDRYRERVRAFFELPEGTRGTPLSSIRHLVGGNADASAAMRVIEHYRKSQEPRTTTATRQLLVPLGAFLMTVFVGWMVYTQTGSSSGGGQSSTQVGYLLLLVGLPSVSEVRDRLTDAVAKLQETFTTDDESEKSERGGRNRPQEAWSSLQDALDERISDRGDSDGGMPRRVLGVLLIGGLLVLAVELVLLTFIPLPLLVVLNLACMAGFAFLPGVAFILGRALGPIGIALSKLYFIFAFLPYEKPTIYLTEDDEYELREAAGAGWEDEVVWFRFAKSWVGFTYENSEDAWPGRNTTMPADTVAAHADTLITDGGDDGASVGPKGYAKTSGLSYAGHEGIVPTDPSEKNVHVQTHHVLSWFRDVGRGETLQRAHQYAKDKYGGGERPMSDRMLLAATIMMMLLGIVLDYVAFFA